MLGWWSQRIAYVSFIQHFFTERASKTNENHQLTSDLTWCCGFRFYSLFSFSSKSSKVYQFEYYFLLLLNRRVHYNNKKKVTIILALEHGILLSTYHMNSSSIRYRCASVSVYQRMEHLAWTSYSTFTVVGVPCVVCVGGCSVSCWSCVQMYVSIVQYILKKCDVALHTCYTLKNLRISIVSVPIFASKYPVR